MINNAFINIWGKRVGAIAWDPDTKFATFEYATGIIQKYIHFCSTQGTPV